MHTRVGKPIDDAITFSARATCTDMSATLTLGAQNKPPICMCPHDPASRQAPRQASDLAVRKTQNNLCSLTGKPIDLLALLPQHYGSCRWTVSSCLTGMAPQRRTEIARLFHRRPDLIISDRYTKSEQKKKHPITFTIKR